VPIGGPWVRNGSSRLSTRACRICRGKLATMMETFRGIIGEFASMVPVQEDGAKEIARGGTPVLVNALIGKTDFRKGSISM